MPKKIRVYELAHELGLTNKEALDLCLSLGMGVKSHSSSIEDAQADRARRKADREGLRRPVQPEEPAPPAKKAAATKKAAAKAAATAPAVADTPAPDLTPKSDGGVATPDGDGTGASPAPAVRPSGQALGGPAHHQPAGLRATGGRGTGPRSRHR